METNIRKCANNKCAKIIGVFERPNKKYCSEKCKNKANNNNNSKDNRKWESVFEKYNNLPSETFIAFPRWLSDNYYPPREIKIKK